MKFVNVPHEICRKSLFKVIIESTDKESEFQAALDLISLDVNNFNVSDNLSRLDIGITLFFDSFGRFVYPNIFESMANEKLNITIGFIKKEGELYARFTFVNCTLINSSLGESMLSGPFSYSDNDGIVANFRFSVSSHTEEF